MLAKSLKNYLREQKIPYITIIHSPAVTAQEVAQAARIPGGNLAKTVMVIMDEKLAMAVVPANRRVQLEDLRELTGCHDIRLASEQEFTDCFADCEAGAMPPFGNLYDMEVFVSPALAREPDIVFNAGSHTELIKMNWRDYQTLVKPKVAEFAV